MTDDQKTTDDMNAQEQQNYFNELAEKMMKNEITTEQACSFYKERFLAEADARVVDYEYILKENEELKKENDRLNRTRLPVYQREVRLENAEAELKAIKANNILITKYWYIDEETGETIFDTDEMEGEFHDAMVDLGAYNDELRCMGCDKRFGKTESSFQNAEGLAVCADCFKAEESGEE
jgi:hypothetical protein